MASTDAVVGTLRVKDLVERFVAGEPLSLGSLMRPALQLDAGLPADRVLTLLRDRRAHSAVVIDAQGRALGLVTIQDVLSELLGSGVAPAGTQPPHGATS